MFSSSTLVTCIASSTQKQFAYCRDRSRGKLLLQLPPQALRRAYLCLALADRDDDLLGEQRVEGRLVDESFAVEPARAVADASGRRVESREEGFAVVEADCELTGQPGDERDEAD